MCALRGFCWAKSASEGPNVTRGYWNRPEETARAFVDGFLFTGDVGFMEPDGTFFLVDRMKDMIISGGFTFIQASSGRRSMSTRT
jgi:long-subunit acyl-CoA synthetase (AMP-forming)